MLRPLFEKPKYGQASLLSGHPLVYGLKMALLFNEGGGKYVWDSVSKNAFQFSVSTTHKWEEDGFNFKDTSTIPYLTCPVFNTLLPQHSECTILFGFKKTDTPFYHYMYTTGMEFDVFSMLLPDTGNAHLFINSNEPTWIIADYLSAKSLGMKLYNQDALYAITFMYKDGVAIGAGSGALSIPNITDNLIIGGRADAVNRSGGGIFKWFYLWNRCLSDSEILSISLNPYQIYQRIRLYALAGGNVYSDSVSESNAISDSDSATAIFGVGVAETNNIADTDNAIGTFLRSIAESSTFSETINGLCILLASLSETSTISDSLSGTATFLRSISESSSISDLQTAVKILVGNISESSAISDSITALANFICSVSDNPAITDLFQGIVGNVLLVSDSVSINDSVSNIANYFSSISESNAIQDNLTAIANLLLQVSESQSISDIFTAIRNYLLQVNETVTIADLVTVLIAIIEYVRKRGEITMLNRIRGEFVKLNEYEGDIE